VDGNILNCYVTGMEILFHMLEGKYRFRMQPESFLKITLFMFHRRMGKL